MSSKIRLVTVEDAESILDIYAPYVSNTSVTFEYEAPTLDEMQNRIANISKRLPYLVCEQNGNIIGYTFATKHRERAAYNWSVESSIYIFSNFHRKKVATALYNCLFEFLQRQGYYNVYAGITIPNDTSLEFHKAQGFKTVGTYTNVGYKFSQWHDVIWLQKNLISYTINPSETLSIHDLHSEDRTAILEKYSKMLLI